jgi:hypothetical protein
MRFPYAVSSTVEHVRCDRGGATFPELSPTLGIGRNFSAERAVAIHITNNLNKLGLTSRLRMARWVAGRGAVSSQLTASSSGFGRWATTYLIRNPADFIAFGGD